MENLTFCSRRVWVCFVLWCIGFSLPLALRAGDSSLNSPPPVKGMDPVIFHFNCFDGQPGDTVCVQVTVENFVDIVIGQFEITWNSNVLDYVEIQNPGIPQINVNADFNLSGPNALKFIPLGFPIDGITLPDGSVLFEICFRIIGLPGSTSPVGISPFFEFEVADINGVVPSEFTDCTVNVSNAVDLVGFVTSCGPVSVGGNGEIDVMAFGGTAPYNVTWVETGSGTPGGPTVIGTEGGSATLNVPMGNYDVTFTDASGSSVTYNVNVSDQLMNVTTRLRHPTCYKFSNGLIWVKPQGGTAPYSYIWTGITNPSLAGSGFIRNQGDSSLVTSLPDGMYSILVQDVNGCEAEVTVTLEDKPFQFTIEAQQPATCNGAEDGFIRLSISGGTPDPDDAYMVTIRPGFVVVTNSLTVGLLNPGDHCITVQDEVSQCDTVFCFTIGSSTTISATVATTDASCAGGSDGRVSLRGLTNGVSGPTYSYAIYRLNGTLETNAMNIGGTFNYTPLNPGDYYALVTEGACVSDSIFFSITEPPPIAVSFVGARPDNCIPTPVGDAWFSISGGIGPYLLSAGAGTQDGDTLLNMNSGNYTLTVTDANGCTATLPFRVPDYDDNEEADISFQINGVPCEEGSTVTVLFQGMPIPAGVGVQWSTGAITPTIPITEPDTLSVDVLFGAPIFCILDDTVIINCEIELELDISLIQPLCDNAAIGGPYTGTVIVDTMNAVAPVTWYWSIPDTTNTATYSGLSPGKYYVTVTDAAGSMAIDSFEIIAPPAIGMSFTNVVNTSCPEICDGEVNITPNGGAPLSDYYLYWGSPSQADTGSVFTITDLCAGDNYFTIAQDANCFFLDSVEILAPDSIHIDLVNAVDPTCYGDNDGSLEVAANGGSPGYTYQWNVGGSGAINANIGAGEYYVTATDQNNCTAIDSFELSEPDTLIAQIDISGTLNLSCGSSNDGIVTIDVSGGNTGGYTFTWSPNVSATYQAVNLGAGDYFITVSDPKGCSDTTSYTLTGPMPIEVTWPAIAEPECFGDETIIQISTATGGNGNFTYNINGGELFDLGESVAVPSGIYIVTVFDDRGCSTDTTYTVIEPNPILVSIGPEEPVIDLGDSLYIVGSVDQSDNPIIMTMWSSTAPVSCATCEGTFVYNVVPTEYVWTVTDVNGCQGSASILVKVDYDRDIYIPSAFSPNNDGRNDDFRIFTGLGVEMINSFNIYDRWGNLVHSETNQLPSANGAGKWDGTYNGSPLNPGVYVYVAEITFIDNHTKLVFKGDVTLVR